MNKETLRMQMLAGIITEGRYKQLLEDMEIVDRILDKISSQGKDSLTPEEKKYLDKYSTGERNMKDPSRKEILLSKITKLTPGQEKEFLQFMALEANSFGDFEDSSLDELLDNFISFEEEENEEELTPEDMDELLSRYVGGFKNDGLFNFKKDDDEEEEDDN
jgi:hypothetical protein